jgi:SAM-dependent methyltransferase
MRRSINLFGIALLLGLAAEASFAQEAKRTAFDVPYVPTPQPVVEGMLKLAKVTAGDVVYDLGCGDGRIVITAAKEYGATGVGVDIDPQRIKEAKANAKKAGVTNKVKFVRGDIFKTDFSNATVVMLYLLPEINLRLRPILLEQLKPGTRIVSHIFNMGDWNPDRSVMVNGSSIHIWTVPADKKVPTGGK